MWLSCVTLTAPNVGMRTIAVPVLTQADPTESRDCHILQTENGYLREPSHASVILMVRVLQ